MNAAATMNKVAGWWRRRSKTSNAPCVVNPKGQGRPFFAVGHRITQGGMFVDAQWQPTVNSVVIIDIAPSDSRPLRVRARVVHVEPEGFGCIFTRISNLSQTCLTRWLGRTGGMPAVSGTIEV